MNYWLVKSEPEAYAYADLVREGVGRWDGVRNYQARNHLRAMQPGDLVLFYHSVSTRAVVGYAEVVRAAYPDPTTDDDRWVAVDLRPCGAFARPVTLVDLKADPALRDLPLIRQSRLSVMPLPRAAFDQILAQGAPSA